MYQESELTAVQAQIKKRYIILAIPTCVMLAGIVVTLCLRTKDFSLEWLTSLLTVLMGAMIIFCDGLLISPVRRYRQLLKDVMGRTSRTEGFFKSFDEQTCLREGVVLHPMLISVNDLKDEEDDRLFYFDALKTFPALTVGQPVTIIHHDKTVADIAVKEK